RFRGYAAVERLCETRRLDADRSPTEHLVARRDEPPGVPLADPARRFRRRRPRRRSPLEPRDLAERASALGGAAGAARLGAGGTTTRPVTTVTRGRAACCASSRARSPHLQLVRAHCGARSPFHHARSPR